MQFLAVSCRSYIWQDNFTKSVPWSLVWILHDFVVCSIIEMLGVSGRPLVKNFPAALRHVYSIAQCNLGRLNEFICLQIHRSFLSDFHHEENEKYMYAKDVLDKLEVLLNVRTFRGGLSINFVMIFLQLFTPAPVTNCHKSQYPLL